LKESSREIEMILEKEQSTLCDLCGRRKPLTKHHLIPRGVRRKKRFVNRFGKQEIGQRSLMLCKDCHNGIHDLIPDEKEVAEKYSTKELLLANEAIQKHVSWVRKQK
jgi:hypothetical protein